MKALALASVLLLSTATLANCGGMPPDIDKGSTADSVKDSSIAAADTTTTGLSTASTTTVEDSAQPPASTEATTGSGGNEAQADVQKEIDDAYAMGYEHGYRQAMQETQAQTYWLSGDFTATLQKKLPDYISDPDTPRVAILTLFQSAPILVRIEPEILQDLQEEETYTFVLKGQEIPADSLLLGSEGWVDDEVLNGIRLELDKVRKPTEDEYGLQCNRMQAVDNTHAVG